MKTLDQLIKIAITEKLPQELALGFLRYEALRKLNARQYAELCKENLQGAFFDDLVDREIMNKQTK